MGQGEQTLQIYMNAKQSIGMRVRANSAEALKKKNRKDGNFYLSI